jgi:hypothetical protein
VASDPTSLEKFRKHQELKRIPILLHIPIIPQQIFPFYASMPTVARIPVFNTSAQNVFAFPYVPAPAIMLPKEQPKKRKYKSHEREFKCVCEKERVLSQRCG